VERLEGIVQSITAMLHCIIFSSLCVIIFCSGCNPFAPALKEGTTQNQFSDLTQTENVFRTFRNAYTFKDTALYASLLSDNFTFVFRNYDIGVDVSWGRDDEMRSTQGLFSNAQQLHLVWNAIISQNLDTTNATILRAFNLTITFNPSDILRIDGYANIKLRRATKKSFWKILQWRDESNF
jgi:hypothetical protein